MVPTTHVGQAFGLQFRCGFPLPELSVCIGEFVADAIIDIDWGTAASGALVGPARGSSFDYADHAFRLRIAGVATYRVTTNCIAIAPEPGADDRSIRAFLFGSAIGALLQMRGLMVLHGSAIAMPGGGAAVFCGHSTAGKSTLAAALASRGHITLADDVTAVRFDSSGDAWCLPGLARTKLWRDALETLGLADRANATTRVMPDMDKHSLHMSTSTEPVRMRCIYELQVVDSSALSFGSVVGMDKFNLLLTHTYRPAYLPIMGRQQTLMRNAAALAPQLMANRIVRPRSERTLNTIVTWLERQWASSTDEFSK